MVIPKLMKIGSLLAIIVLDIYQAAPSHTGRRLCKHGILLGHGPYVNGRKQIVCPNQSSISVKTLDSKPSKATDAAIGKYCRTT